MAIRNLKTYTPTKEELIEMDGEEPLTLIESANFESLGITEEEAEENEIKTLKENAQIFLRNLKRSVEKCSPKTPLDILKATLTLDDGSSVKFSQGHHGKIAFGEGDRVHYNAHLIKLAEDFADDCICETAGKKLNDFFEGSIPKKKEDKVKQLMVLQYTSFNILAYF